MSIAVDVLATGFGAEGGMFCAEAGGDVIEDLGLSVM